MPPTSSATPSTAPPHEAAPAEEGEAAPLRDGSRPRRRRDWRKWLSPILCLLVLLFSASIFYRLATLKTDPPRQEVPVKTYNVQTFLVEPASVREIVSAFGTAQADDEVVLTAQVAGQIVETHPRLKVGTSVEAADVDVSEGRSRRSQGQLLLRIDPSTYQQRVEKTQRALQENAVELRRLEQQHEHNQSLLEVQKQNLETAREELQSRQRVQASGAGSATALRQAELQVRQYEEAVKRLENEIAMHDVLKAQVEARAASLQSDLEIAQLELSRTEVRPPFDGTISEVMIERGQFVQPGTSLLRLTDSSMVEIPVPLTQSQYALIGPSLEEAGRLPVELAVNETAPAAWHGEVVRVDPRADPTTRTLNVYVEVENGEQPSPLLPGTFVHARILGPVHAGQILVPRDAIVAGSVFVARPEGEGRSDAVAERRPIEVARAVQAVALVEAGLAPGEQLVMTNLDVVSDGARLAVQAKSTLAEELARQRIEVFRPIEPLTGTPLGE